MKRRLGVAKPLRMRAVMQRGFRARQIIFEMCVSLSAAWLPAQTNPPLLLLCSGVVEYSAEA